MNPTCSFKALIQDAARSDRWPPELLDHVKGCDDCADLTVAEVLRTTSAHPHELYTPLNADRIWFTAELARRTQVKQQAVGSIEFVQCALAAVGIVVSIVMVLPGTYGFVGIISLTAAVLLAVLKRAELGRIRFLCLGVSIVFCVTAHPQHSPETVISIRGTNIVIEATAVLNQQTERGLHSDAGHLSFSENAVFNAEPASVL